MTTKQIFRHLWVAGLLMCIFGGVESLSAQTNVSINATGAIAHPSAILDVSSTTSGMLVPRMTSAEKNAIASPADGLLIYQTDEGAGFWYYDGTTLKWVTLPRYLAGNVEMDDPPSTIIQGSGYTVTRLGVGTDQIDFNEPLGTLPIVMLTSSYSDGSAPFLEDYCIPEFTSCGCNSITILEVFGGNTVGNTPIISNDPSDCNGQPDAYEYYPAGHPVYVMSGDPDLCLGSSSQYTLRYSGNFAGDPCGTHRIHIWIDWQHDGFFDAGIDQVVNTPVTDWGSAAAVVRTIPAAAYAGDTFMRVVAIPNAPANSCPGGANGETEEYNVHVSCRPPAVYDDVPSYCNVGDFTNNAFRVSCRRTGGEPRNVQNYYFQVNEEE